MILVNTRHTKLYYKNAKKSFSSLHKLRMRNNFISVEHFHDVIDLSQVINMS